MSTSCLCVVKMKVRSLTTEKPSSLTSPVSSRCTPPRIVPCSAWIFIDRVISWTMSENARVLSDEFSAVLVLPCIGSQTQTTR